MFLELQVNVSVTLKYPFGPSMCMAEQLVINLQASQRLRLIIILIIIIIVIFKCYFSGELIALS